MLLLPLLPQLILLPQPPPLTLLAFSLSLYGCLRLYYFSASGSQILALALAFPFLLLPIVFWLNLSLCNLQWASTTLSWLPKVCSGWLCSFSALTLCSKWASLSRAIKRFFRAQCRLFGAGWSRPLPGCWIVLDRILLLFVRSYAGPLYLSVWLAHQLLYFILQVSWLSRLLLHYKFKRRCCCCCHFYRFLCLRRCCCNTRALGRGHSVQSNANGNRESQRTNTRSFSLSFLLSLSLFLSLKCSASLKLRDNQIIARYFPAVFENFSHFGLHKLRRRRLPSPRPTREKKTTTTATKRRRRIICHHSLLEPPRNNKNNSQLKFTFWYTQLTTNKRQDWRKRVSTIAKISWSKLNKVRQKELKD